MIYVRIKDVNEQNDIGTELAQHHLSYSIAVIHREDEVNSRVFRAEKAWQDNDYIYADNISVLIMYFDGMRELPITYGVQKFNRSQYYLQ
jgi:hypothetical protein